GCKQTGVGIHQKLSLNTRRIKKTFLFRNKTDLAYFAVFIGNFNFLNGGFLSFLQTVNGDMAILFCIISTGQGGFIDISLYKYMQFLSPFFKTQLLDRLFLLPFDPGRLSYASPVQPDKLVFHKVL